VLSSCSARREGSSNGCGHDGPKFVALCFPLYAGIGFGKRKRRSRTLIDDRSNRKRKIQEDLRCLSEWNAKEQRQRSRLGVYSGEICLVE
jgi:hypothetical protein